MLYDKHVAARRFLCSLALESLAPLLSTRPRRAPATKRHLISSCPCPPCALPPRVVPAAQARQGAPDHHHEDDRPRSLHHLGPCYRRRWLVGLSHGRRDAAAAAARAEQPASRPGAQGSSTSWTSWTRAPRRRLDPRHSCLPHFFLVRLPRCCEFLGCHGCHGRRQLLWRAAAAELCACSARRSRWPYRLI